MKILSIGTAEKKSELIEKFTHKPNITEHAQLDEVEHALREFDMIFDLDFDEHPSHLSKYTSLEGVTVVAGAVRIQLSRAVKEFGKNMKCRLVGMNTLPTFINREKAELSVFDPADQKEVAEIFRNLGFEPLFVEDRVGMVTPRIVLMIINEACFTVQEGTADMEAIDQGMKLGTNYPFGPFEWADKIGINNVFETLDALYKDTQDERYKICPLLKTRYLKGQRFYQ